MPPRCVTRAASGPHGSWPAGHPTPHRACRLTVCGTADAAAAPPHHRVACDGDLRCHGNGTCISCRPCRARDKLQKGSHARLGPPALGLLLPEPGPAPSSRAQAKLYPRILAAMKPGSTLGLSHGFLLGVMQVGGAAAAAECGSLSAAFRQALPAVPCSLQPMCLLPPPVCRSWAHAARHTLQPAARAPAPVT